MPQRPLTYSLTDIAKDLGLTTQHLHYYRKIGLIPQPTETRPHSTKLFYSVSSRAEVIRTIKEYLEKKRQV